MVKRKNIKSNSSKLPLWGIELDNKFQIKNRNKSHIFQKRLTFENLLNRLKKEGFKDKTIKSIKSVYQSYKKYIIEKYNSTNLLGKNKDCEGIEYNENFYSKKSIEEYVNSLSVNKIGTKKKKMYILIKTLFQLKTGYIKKRNINGKNINKEIIPGVFENEIIEIFNKIYETNNIDLIMIYQLSFELGLNFEQIMNIKLMNIKKNFDYISFKLNKRRIYRSLNVYSSCLLNFFILKNEKRKMDYIIFSDIKGPKKERIKKCKKKFFDLLNLHEINDFKFNKKILNFINKKHYRIKINSIIIKKKEIFFEDIWKELGFDFNPHKNNENKNKETPLNLSMKIFNNEDFYNNSEFININKDYSEIKMENKDFFSSINESELENFRYEDKSILYENTVNKNDL